MATAATTSQMQFPASLQGKRRRMRSGNNVSTLTNNEPRPPSDNEPVVTLAEADDVGEKIVQTSKCKGATTIPIFLKSEFVCYVQYHTVPYLPYLLTDDDNNKYKQTCYYL